MKHNPNDHHSIAKSRTLLYAHCAGCTHWDDENSNQDNFGYCVKHDKYTGRCQPHCNEFQARRKTRPKEERSSERPTIMSTRALTDHLKRKHDDIVSASFIASDCELFAFELMYKKKTGRVYYCELFDGNDEDEDGDPIPEFRFHDAGTIEEFIESHDDDHEWFANGWWILI